jgi:hypothetical protein
MSKRIREKGKIRKKGSQFFFGVHVKHVSENKSFAAPNK